MKTTFLLALITLLTTTHVEARENPVLIWPSIPFVRGADLCQFHNASQSRHQYLQTMIGHARELLNARVSGYQALALLREFEQSYQTLNRQVRGLEVTLEASFLAFIDQYHRDLRPRVKKIRFARRDLQDDQLPAQIDFFAYATFTLSPDCREALQVTLHLMGRGGLMESYTATGHPSTVMSQIASQVYTEYQRTHFPSTLKIGNQTYTLIGGLNGSVDEVQNLDMAELACETLGGRLPNAQELDLIHTYGDWSGGVSLGRSVWALPGGKVFHPGLRNPSPVREPWEVNAKSFKYYCLAN